MSTLISNKKASFDYELLEQFSAGAELFGYEVKSLRAGKGKLEGAHVLVRGGEAYLVGASIAPFQAVNTPKSYDPERPRRLLLTKKERNTLLGADSAKGLTIVAISWYTKGRYIKLALAIARGKKKQDKREDIKEKETKRIMARVLKGSRE